jgi:hypothetical protein
MVARWGQVCGFAVRVVSKVLALDVGTDTPTGETLVDWSTGEHVEGRSTL